MVSSKKIVRSGAGVVARRSRTGNQRTAGQGCFSTILARGVRAAMVNIGVQAPGATCDGETKRRISCDPQPARRRRRNSATRPDTLDSTRTSIAASSVAINAVATAVRVLPALEADCLRRAMLALASSAGGALQRGGAGAARSATRRSLCGALARCAHAAVRRQAVKRGLIAPLTDLEHALPHRYGADRNGRPPTRRY